ncbi:MAG: helix-turn-helix transcriptional regulator [Thermoguttaceae bacterium]
MDHSEKPTIRHWKLLRLLAESPQSLPLKELAEHLGVTPRTVNRDLALLQKAGIPLQETIGPHGLKHWFIAEKENVPLGFSYDEAAALYLGRRFLAPLTKTFLWEAADSALRKIRNRIGAQAIRYLDRLLDTFRHTTIGWSDYSEKGDLVDALVLGCEERREVLIGYRSLTANTEESYAIRPYELVYHEGTLYVIGFSCKSDGLRHWKIDRMSSALATDTKFEMPNDFDANSYRKSSFAVFAPKDMPTQRIKVRFNQRVARYVEEHHWHETQSISVQKDGSVLAEFELAATEELKRWLLSFGMHAEVLEPPEFREELRVEIEGMQNCYSISSRRMAKRIDNDE